MTKVKLKEATKELNQKAGEILEESARIRRSAEHRFLSAVLALMICVSLFAGLAAPKAEAAGSASYVDFVEFGMYAWNSRGIGIAALRTDGTVALWDPDAVLSGKELSRVRAWKNVVQLMDAGEALLALRADGTVDAAIYDEKNAPFDRSAVNEWRNIRMLVCYNAYHCYAVGWDGKLYYTGGELFTDMEPYDFSRWTNLKKLVAGVCPKSEYMLGLCWDGTVIDNRVLDSQMEGFDLPWSGETKNIVDIASNGWLDLALRADGTVLLRGTDRRVYEKTIRQWKNVASVCFVQDYAVGLLKDGTVVCVDSDLQKAVSGWRNVRTLLPLPGYYALIAVLADGSVKTAYLGEYDPFSSGDLENWTNIKRICAGDGIIYGEQADGHFLTVGFDLKNLK